MTIKTLLIIAAASALSACSHAQSAQKQESSTEQQVTFDAPQFEADSAFAFVKRQTEFGPRIPNTPAHTATANWLIDKMKSYGFEVIEQRAPLKAFDGTTLNAVNIFARHNPDADRHTLLLAHWDTRPWADSDPDPAKHKSQLDGANDGASGVGILLELARLISLREPGQGVDILFVDAEDWGDHNDEDSWALGAQYFVENPVIEGYIPDEVILLDMVGGKGARFHHEYFSQINDPGLVDRIWGTAHASGYGDYFPTEMGGAITDDHVQFINAGIPAIDIIEYNETSGTGFNPTWHTTSDTIDNISPETLKAVGQTLTNYLYRNH